MKLINLRVENYKCIEDSTEFAIDQVTCLVGKNEAGKTALLESLYKLNPLEMDEGDFDELEYPRRFVATYRQRQQREPANVLTTIWELESAEINKLNDLVGEGVVTQSEVVIKKGYDNELKWSIQLDEDQLIQNLITSFKLDASERSPFQKTETIRGLMNKLGSLEAPTQKQASLLAHLNKEFPAKSAVRFVSDILQQELPIFVYFDVFDKLPGRIALTNLKQRVASKNLGFGHKIFLALLDMTSSGLNEVESIGESEKLIMELEAIENSLTDQIFEYWTQNRHLDVKFRFDPARPNDPPPFNEGFIFNTRIYNRRHRATVNFDERSSGFIWFFSFLIWFSQVKRNYGNKLILLLDEPGLSLHGKAQKDLLRYINEKLRPEHQVIYTAHSPFMIDTEYIFSLRTVEDMVEQIEENGKKVERIIGTKVGQRVLSRDEDTLFPLQGILGYDIAQTMFVGPYVIVVEGPTEAAFLNWFSRKLLEENREGLDIRWAICPAEGASKVSSFITLFHGRGLKIAALLDYHNGQKRMVEKLEASGLLPSDHLLKTTSYVDQNEADIEDLVGRDMYVQLVNGAMALPEHLKMSSQKSDNAKERVVKEAEVHCRLLPAGFVEFNHYLPVEYLMRMPAQEVSSLPGLPGALERFEKLLHDLNLLIKQP